MALVRKSNVVLEVTEEALPRFLDNGFDIIDESGKVVKQAIPNDPAALKKALVEALQKIEKLEAELASVAEKSVEDIKPTKRAKKTD